MAEESDFDSACEDCGTKNETVRDVTCPLAEEIHSETVHVTLCTSCYHERSMAI